MTPEAIRAILDAHADWMMDRAGGKRADLSGADLRGAELSGACLRESDLSRSILIRANLRGANLIGADLTDASLSKAILRGAKLDLDGVPVIPDIHRAIYAAASQPDALDMDHWHTCKTTHCRAGWVIALAAAAGKELEKRIGTDAAAALIYMASDPTMERIPDWYASDEDALADMRRLAEAA